MERGKRDGRRENRQSEYNQEQTIRFNAVQARHNAERILRAVGRNPTAAEFSYLPENAKRIRNQAATSETGLIVSISTEQNAYREIAKSIEEDLRRTRNERPSRVQALLNTPPGKNHPQLPGNSGTGGREEQPAVEGQQGNHRETGLPERERARNPGGHIATAGSKARREEDMKESP